MRVQALVAVDMHNGSAEQGDIHCYEKTAVSQDERRDNSWEPLWVAIREINIFGRKEGLLVPERSTMVIVTYPWNSTSHGQLLPNRSQEFIAFCYVAGGGH